VQITQLNENFSQKIFDLESKIDTKDTKIAQLEKLLYKSKSKDNIIINNKH